MSYHVYHTPALVLGSMEKGEGDCIIVAYTRELGLLLLHAKSIREGRSRLRYALQAFALADMDIIRGKHGWKLISARQKDSHSALWMHPRKRRIIASSAHLLRRLIQGEEGHAELFDDMLCGLQFLHTLEDEAELRSAEVLFAIRMLASLGYWGKGEEFPALLPSGWSQNSLLQVSSRQGDMIAEVNRSLKKTQL